MSSEQDFIGMAPGEWMFRNSSAEEIFGMEGDDAE